MLSLWGISLYGYGLIVGVALVLGILAIELRFRRWVRDYSPVIERQFWQLVVLLCLGGLVGARLWHVMTDWHLYTNNWLLSLAFWRGGLSIIGAVVVGSLFAWGASIRRPLLPSLPAFKLTHLMDVVVFGLPLAQAIGRWGNYLNHELYGTISSLPWAIYIPATNQWHHPLFAYEAVVVILFWICLQFFDYQTQGKWLGTGWYFLAYVFWYAGWRFLLDFLRVEKQIFIGSLGINQVFLIFVLVLCSLVGYYRYKHGTT